MPSRAPAGRASPPQEEHDGVDGHDGDAEESPGHNNDHIVAWVGHQDVGRNFCPEGQEAINPWEAETGKPRELIRKMPCRWQRLRDGRDSTGHAVNSTVLVPCGHGRRPHLP